MLSLAAVACGGDDDGGNDDGNATGTRTPATARAAGSVTAGASPIGGVTSTPDPDADPIESLAPADQTAIAADIEGGDPNLDPVLVATAPAVATGSSDPDTIAEPSGPPSGIRFLIDLNASAAGIQSSRDISVGDTIRVAIVAANTPLGSANGGMSAVQFTVNYETAKLFSPTISGGPSTDRNPALSVSTLGEGLPWQCLPAAEGDKDVEGGIDGDGNPANGEAFLSCFEIERGIAEGTFVIGIIEFQALASGTVDLTLTDTLAVDFLGLSIAACSFNESPVVPCDGATLNIR